MVKDILREIKGRKLQFLAILLITTLGVGFFIGIRVTGYDMRLTADAYMESANVLDLKVMHSLGVDEEMRDEIDARLENELKQGNLKNLIMLLVFMNLTKQAKMT